MGIRSGFERSESVSLVVEFLTDPFLKKKSTETVCFAGMALPFGMVKIRVLWEIHQ